MGKILRIRGAVYTCRTTALSRSSAAEVRARCDAQPPGDCYALACPLGPTRPCCESGKCVAVP